MILPIPDLSGFIAVQEDPECDRTCLLSVYVDPEHRKNIRMKTVRWCMDQPFVLGFEWCRTFTDLKRSVKLFEMLSRRSRYVIVNLGLKYGLHHFLYGKGQWDSIR